MFKTMTNGEKMIWAAAFVAHRNKQDDKIKVTTREKEKEWRRLQTIHAVIAACSVVSNIRSIFPLEKDDYGDNIQSMLKDMLKV